MVDSPDPELQSISYNIMDFGQVPYGRRVRGQVYLASPLRGCQELEAIDLQGSSVVLMERGDCHFAEKMLNAQKIGAKMVMIFDNGSEKVDAIFPIERDRALLDQLGIPGLFVERRAGERLRELVEKGQTEVEASFDLVKSGSMAEVLMLLQVDDYASYVFAGSVLYDYARWADRVRFSVFLRESEIAGEGECSESRGTCLPRGHSNFLTREEFDINAEFQRQVCLLRLPLPTFARYIERVGELCFDTISGSPSRNFSRCSQTVRDLTVPASQLKGLDECEVPGSATSKEASRQVSMPRELLSIDYSPLILINRSFYKGNFDDEDHFFETLCLSFDSPPFICDQYKSFAEVEELTHKGVLKYLIRLCLFSILGIAVLIFVAHSWLKNHYRKNLRKELHQRLREYKAKNPKTAEAISESSSCQSFKRNNFNY